MHSIPSIETLWIDVFTKYNPLWQPTPIRKSTQIRAETLNFISPVIQDRRWCNNQKRPPYIFFLYKTVKDLLNQDISFCSFNTHNRTSLSSKKGSVRSMQKHPGLLLRKEISYIFPLYFSSHYTPLISSCIIICINFSVSFIVWSIGHSDILGHKGLQSPCLMQPTIQCLC